jgi:hypothetical protein
MDARRYSQAFATIIGSLDLNDMPDALVKYGALASIYRELIDERDREGTEAFHDYAYKAEKLGKALFCVERALMPMPSDNVPAVLLREAAEYVRVTTLQDA